MAQAGAWKEALSIVRAFRRCQDMQCKTITPYGYSIALPPHGEIKVVGEPLRDSHVE